MRQSEQINELAGALAKAQAKIEGAVKATLNPHFRSQYADLGNVWAAIREPLTSNGLSVVQLLRGVDRGVECETMMMHASGQFIAETLFMPANKIDAQGYGSACTYARRYGLQAMVGIAPVDDDGNGARDKGGDNEHRDPPPPKPPANGPKSVENGKPLHEAHNEITNGTASTAPQKKKLPMGAGPPDPKTWAQGEGAHEFLARAKTDLATILDKEHLAQWSTAFAWECQAIREHASDRRNDFLNDLLATAQDRCRLPADLRAAG